MAVLSLLLREEAGPSEQLHVQTASSHHVPVQYQNNALISSEFTQGACLDFNCCAHFFCDGKHKGPMCVFCLCTECGCCPVHTAVLKISCASTCMCSLTDFSIESDTQQTFSELSDFTAQKTWDGMTAEMSLCRWTKREESPELCVLVHYHSHDSQDGETRLRTLVQRLFPFQLRKH